MRRLSGFLALGLILTVAAGHHSNVEHDTSVVLELEGQVETVVLAEPSRTHDTPCSGWRWHGANLGS